MVGMFLFLMSCNNSTTAGPGAGLNMASTTWNLEHYGDPASPQAAIPDARPTLSFTETEISGSTGCNTFSAMYTIQGNTIQITDPIQTLMSCSDQNIIDQEKAVTDLLINANQIAWVSDTLTLAAPDGVLIFSVSQAAPVEGNAE